MYKLEISLHSLPDSLNKGLRGNRFKYFSKNKKWDFLIAGMCRGKQPSAPLKKAKLKIVRHFWRTLDYDGLVGSMKPIVDALVDCGIIEDDNWNVLGQWDVSQEFRPKKDGPLLEIIVLEA